MTPEEYDALLAKQGGVCAICKQLRLNSRQKHLCVDHDHRSGKFRGLLCARCNTMLRWVENDSLLLFKEQAEAYLKRYT